ncbi:uncharacterized protein TNCV_4018421 [Trichonephila clavipes]|nr:uncharacterized protein TNCV_4018421 [Trichonephila clavipes]
MRILSEFLLRHVVKKCFRFSKDNRGWFWGKSIKQSNPLSRDSPNPVSQKAYDRINAKIADISEALANASMKKAAAEEKIIDRTVNSVVVNSDGTWKTRGHTSLIGVCALIGADCGKVLDMEVMSSYCKGCDSDKGPKLGPKYSAFLAKNHIFCRKTIVDLLEKWKFAECRKLFSDQNKNMD